MGQVMGTGHWTVDNGTDIGTGDVGQDIGRWTMGVTLGLVTKTWVIVIDM